jgi:hypothetical protein
VVVVVVQLPLAQIDLDMVEVKLMLVDLVVLVSKSPQRLETHPL